MPKTSGNKTRNYTNFYKKFRQNPMARISVDFAASVILIMVLFIFAIKPTIITINELRNKAEDLQKLNNDLVKKINTLEKLNNEYQSLKQIIILANQALPGEHNFLLYEQQFRYFTQKNALLVSSLSFSQFPLLGEIDPPKDKKDETKTNSSLPVISFSLTAKGNYTDVKNFISNMEKHIRITSIDQVSIQGDKKSQGEKITFSMRGKIYYQSNL